MNSKSWLIFSVICVGILGGLIYMSQANKVDVSAINQDAVLVASKANGNIADHILGDKTSKVRLIEYGDFQCPFCGKAHPQVKNIVDEYGSKIVFIFRNYPITTLHQNAKAAAAAAEAAGLQDKYWEMHDKLYELQDEWSNLSTDKRTDYFVGYAKTIGVSDIEKFRSDMELSSISKKINFDFALGAKNKVTGTPAFFLNGKMISEEVVSDWLNGDGSKIREKIDQALK